MIQISPFHHLFKAVPECKDGYEKLGSSTMCLVDSDDVISAGVSEEAKRIILQEHNRYRAMVDPPASNMMKIVRSISIYVCLFKNLWKMLRSDQIKSELHNYLYGIKVYILLRHSSLWPKSVSLIGLLWVQVQLTIVVGLRLIS